MKADINYTMDKLNGLAALFGPEGMNDSRSLSVEASNGICLILEDCARDLDKIGRQHEKALAWKSEREHRLEQTLVNFASYLDKDPDGPDLKTMAANIRSQLSR